MEKFISYAARIQDQVLKMFEDDAENYIDLQEFEDQENFKQFLHAISTVVPTSLFNKIADKSEERNHLEFNQMANSLCFEYCEKP